MSEYKPIDILENFASLYAQEDLLGFFEFVLPRPGKEPVSGLCKISKPKSGGEGGSGRPKYLSLTFVVDTPDDGARQAIEAVLANMGDGGLRATLPQITEVLLLPSMSSSADNYVQQADVLLAERIDPGQFFVAERLLPALRAATPLTIGEMTWWEEDAAPTAAAVTSASKPEASLTSSVRKLLTERWGRK